VLGAFHVITVDFFAWTPGSLMFSQLATHGEAPAPILLFGAAAVGLWIVGSRRR
jgi:hypothetical protein